MEQYQKEYICRRLEDVEMDMNRELHNGLTFIAGIPVDPLLMLNMIHNGEVKPRSHDELQAISLKLRARITSMFDFTQYMIKQTKVKEDLEAKVILISDMRIELQDEIMMRKSYKTISYYTDQLRAVLNDKPTKHI